MGLDHQRRHGLIPYCLDIALHSTMDIRNVSGIVISAAAGCWFASLFLTLSFGIINGDVFGIHSAWKWTIHEQTPSGWSGFVFRVNQWDASTNNDKDMMPLAPLPGTRPSGHQDFPDGVRPVGLQDPNDGVHQSQRCKNWSTKRGNYQVPGPNHQPLVPGLQNSHARSARAQDPNHQARVAGQQDRNIGPAGTQDPNPAPCLFNSYCQFGCLKGEQCKYSHVAHADQMQPPIPKTHRSQARKRIRQRVEKWLRVIDLYTVQDELQEEAMKDPQAKDSQRSSWD